MRISRTEVSIYSVTRTTNLDCRIWKELWTWRQSRKCLASRQAAVAPPPRTGSGEHRWHDRDPQSPPQIQRHEGMDDVDQHWSPCHDHSGGREKGRERERQREGGKGSNINPGELGNLSFLLEVPFVA